MIIGLDIFGQEEYAKTREHGIKDWIEICPPPDPEWRPYFGLTGPCDKDNVTPAFGCEINEEIIVEEQEDAARRWYNNISSR